VIAESLNVFGELLVADGQAGLVLGEDVTEEPTLGQLVLDIRPDRQISDLAGGTVGRGFLMR
jgi:hypothetical protein